MYRLKNIVKICVVLFKQQKLLFKLITLPNRPKILSCESKIPKLRQHFQPFYINYNIGSKLMVIKAQVTICITLFK